MSNTATSSLLNLSSMSLRRRFAVLLGGIAVITFILTFALAQYMLSATEHEFEQRSVLLTEALGAESMLNLLMQDTEGLQESLQRVVERDMAVAAAFYAADGTLLAGQQLEERLPSSFATIDGAQMAWTTTTDDQPVLIAARPVERTGELGGGTDEPAGHVLVAVPSDDIVAHKRTANMMALALLVVIGAIAWYVHRKLRHTVTEPVDQLRRAAVAVENGELSTRVAIDQNDEIGQLARSFNAMVAASEDNMTALEEQGEQSRAAQEQAERLQHEADEERAYLQRQFERISEVIEAATEGDLTQRLRVERDDAVGILMEQLNRMLDDLENLIREVQTAGRSLAEAAHVAASSAEEMSAGAQEQAQQTGEVAASIEEMSATIATSSQHAHDSNQMAQRASELAENGEEVFEQTTEGMGRIAKLVRASADKVEQLGASSGQIGEIVETIEDIADQTNLLALNAAIEAARAGEQGRGFAVVADEVRKLAERTTGATDEIARMIREIQHNTEEVVSSMSRGTEEVENGLHLSGEASQSLGEIVASIQGMVRMIEQITVASEQQAGASTQIAQNVDAIASVAGEVSHSTAELARMADDMNGQSDVLQRLIARFHIRNAGSAAASGDGAATASIAVPAG